MLFRDHVEVTLGRIDSDHAPIGSAVMAWRRNRAAQTRRCEQAVVARIVQKFANGGLLLFRRERINIFFGEGLPGERRRLGGKGLRGRAPFPRDIRLRDRPLLDRPQGLSRYAIEYKQKGGRGAGKAGDAPAPPPQPAHLIVLTLDGDGPIPGPKRIKAFLFCFLLRIRAITKG